MLTPSVEVAFSLIHQRAEVIISYLKEVYSIQLSSSYPSLSLIVIYQEKEILEELFQDLKQSESLHFFLQINVDSVRIIIVGNTPDFFRSIYSLKSPVLKKCLDDSLAFSKNDEFLIQNTLLDLKSPKLMGILNATPDSFYDGGKYCNLEACLKQVGIMIEEGASIIDVGGESTKPGAEQVDEQEEIKRTLPIIKGIKEHFEIPISIDTSKPFVADVALSNGATIVNDVSFLREEKEMISVLKKHEASYCLMHSKEIPKTMQRDPKYNDIVADVLSSFAQKIQVLKSAGISEKRICIDLGIGFGKTIKHNIYLLQFLPCFLQLNLPILIGTSNKSFIGKILDQNINNRFEGTLSSHVISYLKGASLFRTHDIRGNYQALKIATALNS